VDNPNGPPEGDAPAAWRVYWPPLSYWGRVAAVVVAVVILARVIASLQSVVLVIVAAMVIAIGVQPALAGLERRGLRRGTAMGLVIVAGLVLAVAALAAITPVILTQASAAVARLPEVIEEITSRWPALGDLISNGEAPGEEESGGGLVGMAAGLAASLFNLVTLLILIPYFAVAMPTLKSGVFRLLRRQHREHFVYVINRATELTSNYIMGNLLISMATATVTSLGLWLIGVPYPLALGAWMGITDLIPAVGGLLGGIPVLVVAALTGTPELIWSAVLLLGYQQFENYVLAPRVMNKAVDLSPAAVILAVLVGGHLAGFIGALLALPVAAMTKILVTELVVRDRIDTVRADNVSTPARRPRGRLGSRPLP
jgi:predicted PurR-regulated permease PerM